MRSLTFPPFVANGNYQLEVTWSDYNRNNALTCPSCKLLLRNDRTVDEINAVDFAARTYLSFITIVEPGAPTQTPV
jgi:hypothetical protein